MACRRDLNDFLVTALNRAVTFKQVYRVAFSIGQKLDLDVAGPVKEALNEHGWVTKGRTSLGYGTVKGCMELVHAPYNTHTAATTAHSRLNNDRETHFLDEGLSCIVACNGSRRTRHNRHLSLARKVPGLGLVAQAVNGLGTRAHECNSRFLYFSRKFRVLGQESIPGVNHVHFIFLGNMHNAVHIKVGGHRGQTLANLEGEVSLGAVRTHPVFCTVNSYRL